MSLIDTVRDTHMPSATQLIPFNSSSVSATSNNRVPDIPASITQTERLLTTRSRSVNHLEGGGDRGERAYIKLITTDPTRSMSRHGEGSDSQPTSLTTGENVLNQAINGQGYASFLLTDVQCNLEERLQITEVFGDAEVSYYFGRQPIMFNFSGILVDSVDNNWFIQWLEMYTHVMRGTQLARNYELIKLVLPNMTITGTMTRTNWAQNSSRDVDIPFQFSFLAKQIIPQPVTLPNKPLVNAPVIDWDKAQGFLSQAGINSIKVSSASQKLNEIRDVIADPTSTVKDYAGALGDLGSGMTGIDPVAAYQGGDITKFGGTTETSDSNSITNGITSIGNLFGGVTANLSGIRASLFSPVYGVLSSLTKLIKNVSGGLGGVSGAFSNPIRDILRDVRNISNEAIGVVNLINNSINGITNQVNNFNNDIISTVSLLKKTAGVITSLPESVGQSVTRLVHAGKLPLTAGFLTTREFKTLSNGTKTNSKVALLSSGKPHTPESGAKL